MMISRPTLVHDGLHLLQRQGPMPVSTPPSPLLALMVTPTFPYEETEISMPSQTSR